MCLCNIIYQIRDFVGFIISDVFHDNIYRVKMSVKILFFSLYKSTESIINFPHTKEVFYVKSKSIEINLYTERNEKKAKENYC